MRDDIDYQAMEPPELRSHLQRVAKEVATWSFAVQSAKQELNRYYIDGYRNSRSRSVTERKMEAEMASEMFFREVLEAEGQLMFHSAIRDLIVELLR